MRRWSHCAFVCVFFALVFTGCDQDAQIDQNSGLFEGVEGKTGLFWSNLDDLRPTFTEVREELLVDHSHVADNGRNPNAQAFGHYTTTGGHTLTFSAIENNGGVHGKGRVTGPIYINMKMRSDCVEVVDNRASIAGEILSIDLGDNPFNIPLEEGWFFYYAVEDNGEDSNAAPDRFHSRIYWGMPGLGSFCDVLTPADTDIWPEELWVDVVGQSDQIQVE